MSNISPAKGFKIIGLSTRTTNKDGKSVNDMKNLCESFFSQNISSAVENKISNEILIIYTDYKSNFKEDYTAIIGVPVSNLEKKWANWA